MFLQFDFDFKFAITNCTFQRLLSSMIWLKLGLRRNYRRVSASPAHERMQCKLQTLAQGAKIYQAGSRLHAHHSSSSQDTFLAKAKYCNCNPKAPNYVFINGWFWFGGVFSLKEVFFVFGARGVRGFNQSLRAISSSVRYPKEESLDAQVLVQVNKYILALLASNKVFWGRHL